MLTTYSNYFTVSPVYLHLSKIWGQFPIFHFAVLLTSKHHQKIILDS